MGDRGWLSPSTVSPSSGTFKYVSKSNMLMRKKNSNVNLSINISSSLLPLYNSCVPIRRFGKRGWGWGGGMVVVMVATIFSFVIYETIFPQNSTGLTMFPSIHCKYSTTRPEILYKQNYLFPSFTKLSLLSTTFYEGNS